jgi:hypothetical protein
MYDLIIRYLTSLYRPTIIHEVHDLNDSKIYGEDLRGDIVDMFQVSNVVATACIEIWVHDIYSDFDTKKFWDDDKVFEWTLQGLPITRRVSARTVGTDLVAVQPLEAPTGLLNFIDYQHHVQSAMTQQMGIPAERLGQIHHEVRDLGVTAEQATANMSRLMSGVTVYNPVHTSTLIQP